ncbi:hypothetical protein Q4577_13000 [Marinovum sp. 2_MG-2023]|uniref:hypothetical protein n=1 Tax=unclassified Marinovum TaxID=2647166 RepID=UPI0026E2A332|nr:MULTISPECIES: hypothetical protein [unclassified Marinovum]MDO6730943.1 hypothetical protein [Marinovum sp. 2_MG-2023]MDO6780170.1 hypothetical protein [Marinovum sp. 1_MG-2023]
MTAQQSAAGTIIRNIAQITYFDTGLGIFVTLDSNAVEARVSVVPALEVSGRERLLLSRGAIDQFSFEIANTGNVLLDVTPVISISGDTSQLMNPKLFIDLNGNGIVDANEPEMSADDTIEIAAGKAIDLIYAFQAAPGAQPGDSFDVTLTAIGQQRAAGNRIANAPISGVGIGRAEIVAATLEIEKSQAIQPDTDFSNVLYTLRLRNNSDRSVTGYSDIGGTPLRIDGAAATGILLQDAIPLNARFVQMDRWGGMTALYHRAGDGTFDFTTTAPADLGEIDAVAFFLAGDFPMGRSEDVAFTVAVDAVLGAVEIENTAQSFLPNSSGISDLFSNTVSTELRRGETGTLAFIDPVSGGAEVTTGALDSNLVTRLTSGGCNLSSGIDTVEITLQSLQTGDVETTTARETGPNTGIFVIAALPVTEMANPRAQDGVMASGRGDTVRAMARCGGQTLEATLIIAPGNFVFDAINNDPVEGVAVALIDAATGFEVARLVTDARGYFAFGDIDAGRYSYDIVDAPEWSFPTVRLAFGGFGRIITDAAFGGNFAHSGGLLMNSDIPLDPFYGAPLALEKQADRDRVMQGEFVTYTLKVTNNMRQALVGAEIFDRPPYGMVLVPGSVRLDGDAIDDPRRDREGDLVFTLGNLLPLDVVEMSYVMSVGAATREGDLENTALLTGRQAGTGTVMQSAPARAVVRLDNSGGVFARQGTVLGTVFMDCNGNGIQDQDDGQPHEPGIPGVRIVTQEGLFVVTDHNGKYSLPGLRPITHAFQVQAATLPVGTKVAVTRTNDLRRGGSRIVPLRRGELRSENFATVSCTPEAMAEVAARQAHFAANTGPDSLNAADMPIEGLRNPKRSTRTEAGAATTTQLTPAMLAADQDSDAANGAADRPAALGSKARASRRPLESLVKSLDPEPGFLDIEDGETLDRRTQSIRIKAKADLTLGLLVNGRALGADRVGEQTSWAPRNVQAAEFVAVKLRPGKNTLSIVGRDGFGIERLRHDITVTAPGDPARIEITVPAEASADPVNVLPVVVRILDVRGLPVPASATVTLGSDRGLWDVTDIRPGTPGVQAFIDNGEATFGLIPPQVSGPDLITVTSGFAKAEARVTFTPNLEERVMIGVVEGALSLGGKKTGTLLSKDQFNSFEDTTTGLRGDLYLKGAIRGDALLTLRYSSDQDTEDRLFRDIRGDDYYPVYGDNSERGWDAQSSSNLYIKVEKGRSYVLYGDIAIQPESSAFKLGGMQRVATGAKAHWEDDRVSVTVFAARTAQEQQITEFTGRGVSGPYDLNLSGYVTGSERVEILVRDEDGGDILSTTTLRRGTDYILDFFRDTITFDDPVRQFDADGNPVSVRVTYEVEKDDAERYWLYGGEVNYAAGDRTSVGIRAVHADAPIGNPARERLQSAYVRHETLAGGTFEAEIARSENSESESDMAVRLSYDIQTEKQRLSFEAIHTGDDFMAGGLARPGTTQVRLSYGLEINSKSDLDLSAEYVRDRLNDSEKTTLDATYAHRFSEAFQGHIGLELARTTRDGSTNDQAALLLGGNWTPKDRPGVSVRSELRLPFAGDDRDPAQLTLGMYREAKPGWRVQNEIELTFDDGVLMTRSRYGMEYQLNEWLSGSTEFSQAPGDVEETWHQGVAAVWEIDDLTTLRADLEHSRGVDTGDDWLTSIALGAKWKNVDETFVGDADVDATFEEDGNTYYASLGMATEVTEDWTILGRTRVAMDQRNGENHLRARTRIGASYRPVKDPRLDVLAWYEHRLERKHGRTETHMWSVDASYEANEDLRLNAKYAGQHQSLENENVSTSTTTQLVQAGAYLDLADDRVQVGVNASQIWDNRGNATTGLGVELGFSPAPGTLLAIGYNAVDGRVAGMSNVYQEGVYLRFNLLLDDSLWDRLDGFLGN